MIVPSVRVTGMSRADSRPGLYGPPAHGRGVCTFKLFSFTSRATRAPEARVALSATGTKTRKRRSSATAPRRVPHGGPGGLAVTVAHGPAPRGSTRAVTRLQCRKATAPQGYSGVSVMSRGAERYGPCGAGPCGAVALRTPHPHRASSPKILWRALAFARTRTAALAPAALAH
jgi:hypothetical protein